MEGNGQAQAVQDDANTSKLFVTNMDGSQLDLTDLEADLRRLFEPFGKLRKLTVKKSKDRKYCFAFLEYGTEEQANAAIKALDQYEMGGKKMKVRKDKQNEGCFTCQKPGHFARDCPDIVNDPNKLLQNRQRQRELRTYDDRYNGYVERRDDRHERPRNDRGYRDYGDDREYREQRGRDVRDYKPREYKDYKERDYRDREYRDRRDREYNRRDREDDRDYRERRDQRPDYRVSEGYKRDNYGYRKDDRGYRSKKDPDYDPRRRSRSREYSRGRSPSERQYRRREYQRSRSRDYRVNQAKDSKRYDGERRDDDSRRRRYSNERERRYSRSPK